MHPTPAPPELAPDTYPSAYTVSLLPADHPLYDVAAVTVRLHAPSGLWSVDRLGRLLDAHGRWEPTGPRRPAGWYEARRWPLETARRLAEEAALAVRLETGTVADLCRAAKEAR